MNKTEYILLIILLAFSIVSVGGAEQETALEQSTLTAPLLTTSLPVSEPPHSVKPLANMLNYTDNWLDQAEPISRLPFGHTSIPLITSLLFDRVQKPCWLRLADIQRQSNGVVRYSQGTKLNIISTCKLVQQDVQSPLEIPASFSKNLLSNSPPGIIPLL